jgi:hypothetical protein
LALSFAWTGAQVQAFRTYQMDLDEALHASRGLDIASAIQRGSLSDLWFETTKPHWYPPAHGYLLGAWFMLIGASVTTARLYSALIKVILGLLLWVCARQAFPKINPFYYLTPVLFLLGDSQHLILSSLSMADLPANLLAFVSLYFLIELLEKPRVGTTFLCSFFALLSFLVRYGQGVMVFASSGIALLISIRRFKGQFIRNALAWLPTLLLLCLWLIILGHWKWVIDYANVQPGQGEAWSLESVNFYFRQLVGESSGWLPLLIIAIWVVTRFRQRSFPRNLYPYMIFVVVSLAILSYRSDHLARFGTVLFPPLWILSTGAVADSLQILGKPSIRSVIFGVWILALLFLGVKNHRALPDDLRTAYENTNSGVNDAFQFIAETSQLSRQQRVNIVMYGETDDWNSYALHFYLQSQCINLNPGCMVAVIGERELNKGWPPQNSAKVTREERTRNALAAADYLVLFAKTPVLPQGWVEIARGEFIFDRYKVGPRNYQVVILQR